MVVTGAKPTGGDLLVDLLEQLGTDVAFGVVSVHNLPLVDAISHRLRWVPTRGEAGAVNAADRLAPTVNEDADDVPGRRVAADTAQSFSYLVTNPGMIGLSDVVVVDDNGTTNPADDWTAEPVLRGGTNIGDGDRDGVLDPGETWAFVAPASADVSPRRMNRCSTA